MWFALLFGMGRRSHLGRRPLPLRVVPAGISGSATTGKRKAMDGNCKRHAIEVNPFGVRIVVSLIKGQWLTSRLRIHSHHHGEE